MRTPELILPVKDQILQTWGVKMAKFCGRLLWMAFMDVFYGRRSPSANRRIVVYNVYQGWPLMSVLLNVKNAVQLRENVLKNYVAIDLRGGGSS